MQVFTATELYRLNGILVAIARKQGVAPEDLEEYDMQIGSGVGGINAGHENYRQPPSYSQDSMSLRHDREIDDLCRRLTAVEDEPATGNQSVSFVTFVISVILSAITASVFTFFAAVR